MFLQRLFLFVIWIVRKQFESKMLLQDNKHNCKKESNFQVSGFRYVNGFGLFGFCFDILKFHRIHK